MVKVCGVVMAMLPGYQLGTGPADRCVVNVGTVRGRPCQASLVWDRGRLVAS
jgi:hypothetical protein